MKYIYTKKAPKVVGPYSQAIETDDFIFCSGQIGINPEQSKLVDGIENQTHQVMKNLQNVLEESGRKFDQVVKTTIFLTDLNNYKLVNNIYGSYFSAGKLPARSTVQVAGLPAGALVEIEMIAVK